MRSKLGWIRSDRQRGVSLLEVMIAVFVTAIGVLGAAAMQLNALKYTDSSRLSSQASFIVYDVIDRIRANADPVQLGDYDIASLEAVPGSATSVLTTDLIDFANAVAALPAGAGSIDVVGSRVTVEVSWSEGRAGGVDDEGNVQRGELAVTTNVAVNAVGAAP
ncbi:type IV pilus modification protein PilV [uncultured Halopseudomonas sp.]|uniref:type IV pilus modification protein PilV n=1 Tax=uncultured Halopseudomonas sp. TaxID=2901193 RepID=UPI0030EEE07F|tara:strand:+ start:12423 stop:12911 length:489 start_codon:yes stop_codon:yes gene_type:complete